MPRRHISSARRPEIDPPSNLIAPALGRKAPAIMLKQVVLPAPLGPTRAVMERSVRLKLTPSTASRPPNRFETLSSSRSAVIARLPESEPSDLEWIELPLATQRA